MFKISYNTNGLRNINLEDAINKIANYKYSALELSFHKNHIHPLTVNQSDLSKIKKLCESLNINIACIATGADNLLSDTPFEPSLINSTKELREKRIDLLKKSIDIARYLNVPVINFASGKPNKLDDNEAMNYIVEAINELLNYDDNIILAIEPEPGFFIGTSDKAIELIEKINNPRFRMNLDIGHVYCCEENFYTAIINAMKYTEHIHIEDIKDKIHHHEIPGEGDIDFEKVFNILKQYNYEKYISVELYHHSEVCDKALNESISYLENIQKVVY